MSQVKEINELQGLSRNNEETNSIQCKHFVQRKKRFCKMTVKTGFTYCGEHLPQSNDDKNDKTLRVVCPLDNKHTCFSFKLEKHLKVCNARPKQEPYLLKGINCGDGEVCSDNYKSILNSRQLSSVKTEDIKILLGKICKIYTEYIENHIKTYCYKHEAVEEEIRKPEYGDKTKKHLIQASSILGILRAKSLLNIDTCYIEFGAGKGQLSYWISQAIKSLSGSSVLLVEKASHRHKLDNKIDKNETAVHRIKADIGDLLLHEVDVVKGSQRIIGVTKHLCGDATDLSMRCLKNYEDKGGHVSGLVMAFCCHHRCQWSSYVGKEFFNKCGLTRTDFDIICGMVSWAICGTGLGRENTNSSSLEQNQRDKKIGITREEKEQIGRKCKNILNQGRLDYLKQLGYDCSLNYYVEANISPENVCIVAVKESRMK